MILYCYEKIFNFSENLPIYKIQCSFHQVSYYNNKLKKNNTKRTTLLKKKIY